jgi:hypothetical protein
MYSVEKTVNTKPAQSSAPTLMPRQIVCGPVLWTTHEIAVAMSAAITSAVPYWTTGL